MIRVEARIRKIFPCLCRKYQITFGNLPMKPLRRVRSVGWASAKPRNHGVNLMDGGRSRI